MMSAQTDKGSANACQDQRDVLFVGLDPAIRHTGICAEHEGIFRYAQFSGVSLKSVVWDYLRYSKDIIATIAGQLVLASHSVVSIDFTTATYGQRAHQQAIFSMFVGMLVSEVTHYGTSRVDFLLVEPRLVRSYVGLPPKAPKRDVWEAYELTDIDDYSEDVNDARVLMSFGKQEYLNGYAYMGGTRNG